MNSSRVSRPQRLRRLVMLTGLAVLVLATSASAECAWVLWQRLVATDLLGNLKEPYEPLPGQYGVLHAYPNQGACEAALATTIAAKPKGKDLLVCLPDTVDPRGAKGKRGIIAAIYARKSTEQ